MEVPDKKEDHELQPSQALDHQPPASNGAPLRAGLSEAGVEVSSFDMWQWLLCCL